MDFTTKVTLIALSHRLYNSVILISTTKILAAVTLGFQLSQLNLGWYSGVARGGGPKGFNEGISTAEYHSELNSKCIVTGAVYSEHMVSQACSVP